MKFAEPFSKSPQTLMWISGLDLRVQRGKRVDVSATHIDENGFWMNVGSVNAALVQATISWIAIDNSSHCAVGSFQAEAENTKNVSWDGECKFPRGKFSRPPKVLVGFSSFDFGRAYNNTRFGTKVSDITTGGFRWNIYSGDGSTITSATVQWLAIPSEG